MVGWFLDIIRPRGGEVECIAWLPGEGCYLERSYLDCGVGRNSSPISWNFHQIPPVIKDDNWCQALLSFPDLNPNSTWFNVSYLFHLLLGLTNLHVKNPFKNLQATNLFYVQSLNFQNGAITLFILKFWSAFKSHSFICTEVKILANEILCFFSNISLKVTSATKLFFVIK